MREWPAELCRVSGTCVATISVERWTWTRNGAVATAAELADCLFGVRVAFRRVFNDAPAPAAGSWSSSAVLNYESAPGTSYPDEIVAFLGAASLQIDYEGSASPQDMALRAMLSGSNGTRNVLVIRVLVENKKKKHK